MDNLINQLVEEINRKAIEKETRDNEFRNTAIELINRISGEFYNDIAEETFITYPYLCPIFSRGEIKLERSFSKSIDMDRTMKAINLVIKHEKEKEFLEWLTEKALPNFILGDNSANFSYK